MSCLVTVYKAVSLTHHANTSDSGPRLASISSTTSTASIFSSSGYFREGNGAGGGWMHDGPGAGVDHAFCSFIPKHYALGENALGCSRAPAAPTPVPHHMSVLSPELSRYHANDTEIVTRSQTRSWYFTEKCTKTTGHARSQYTMMLPAILAARIVHHVSVLSPELSKYHSQNGKFHPARRRKIAHV